MTSPFDALASTYDAVWSQSPKGRAQREAVWQVIDPLFSPGSSILDLGCGTGDDAVHLAGRGVYVSGIDSSSSMVLAARARGVDARVLSIENLVQIDGPFDGALSNFGALNCVPGLASTACALGRLIRPSGVTAICLMPRFYWREPRRWSGHASWRGIDVYYPTARAIRAAFAPWFDPIGSASIGHGDHQLHLFRRSDRC